jgi:ABC-type nitrate/sulfonate/bicarbonate transport system ATPase subunit
LDYAYVYLAGSTGIWSFTALQKLPSTLAKGTMITLTNVSKELSGINIFKDVNCNIRDKELFALTGPSGSGKTTLLRIIAGTLKPDSGNVVVSSDKIGFVFQDHRLLPWKTSLENVELVFRAAGRSREDSKRKSKYWLGKVGLGQYANYYPSQLSGGMVQRISIARAFAIEPDIILMDEPFSNLDAELADSLMLMVKNMLIEHRTTVVYVTHDLIEAMLVADRLFELDRNGLQEITISNREAMLQAYYKARLKAVTPDLK